MSRFIRLRGLPWSVTNQEILDFLKGVNVVNGQDGINLVTNRWDGKNTGEAFIELESADDEDEAFKHNKGTMGHRYIEIFTATPEEAEMALKKPGGMVSNVVKLRGLPYSIAEDEIEDFFNGLDIKPDREGILIVMDRRGRASGEAYVQFETPDDTEQALKRNREKIGHRYIEIFRSSVAEMRRQSGSRPGPYDKKDRGGPRGGNGGRSDFGNGGRSMRGGSGGPRDLWSSNFGGSGNNFGSGGGFGSNGGGFGNSGGGGGGGRFNNNGGGGSFGNNGGGFGDFNNFGNNRNNFGGSSNNSFDGFNDRNGGGGSGRGNGGGNFGGGGFSSFNLGHDNNRNRGGSGGSNSSLNGGFGPIGGGRNDNDMFCVHMRGLPYNCFESEVTKFFDPVRPVNIKIIYNNKGLHSGSADALFDSHDEAVLAMKKHREQMGNRYIELFFDGKANNRNNFNRRI